jgi:hypothetical protein
LPTPHGFGADGHGNELSMIVTNPTERTRKKWPLLFPTPTTVDGGSLFNRSDSAGAASRPTLGAMAKHNLWPTPQAHDAAKGEAKRVGRHGTKHGGRDLTDWVQMWPTPKSSPSGQDYARTRRPESGGDDLATAVARENFPTPTQRDWKGPRSPRAIKENPGPLLPDVVRGQLNPTWVEWLMGWPLGWTDLAPLAMGRFREWSRQHGGS